MVSRRPGTRRVAVLVLSVVLAMVGWQAAGDPAPPASGQTPPTTAPDLLRDLLNQLFPTTTAPAPATPAVPGDAAPVTPDGPGARPGAPAAPPAPTGPPPDVTGLIYNAQRTGGRTTLPLMEAVGKLRALGFTEEEAAQIGMGHFPVGGPASYRDDFMEFRAGPPVHGHQGTDVFANAGTPLRAPFDGKVSFSEGGLGGKMAYVTAPDGTYYFMAHLQSFAAGLGNGAKVKQGQIVGTVGDTGNARGGAPHLHFEIHPGGGGATNPKPMLDAWLDEAMANIPKILDSFRLEQGGGGIPRALVDAGVLRRFDPPRTASDAEIDTALWAAATDPDAGGDHMAEIREAQAAGQVNPEDVAEFQQALDDAWADARALSRAMVSPITPEPLDAVLGGGE